MAVSRSYNHARALMGSLRTNPVHVVHPITRPSWSPTMVKAVPLPRNYRSVMPAVIVKDAPRALDFYARAFGMEVCRKYLMPDGTIGHAELRHGDTILALAESTPDWGVTAPDPAAPSSASMTLWVDNVDVAFERAVAAGATVVGKLDDQFHGARSGTLRCPFGHRWILATFTQDLPEAEIQKRLTALFG